MENGYWQYQYLGAFTGPDDCVSDWRRRRVLGVDMDSHVGVATTS